MNSLINFIVSKMTAIVNKFESEIEIEKFIRETDLPLFLEFCDFYNEEMEEVEDFDVHGCLSTMAR